METPNRDKKKIIRMEMNEKKTKLWICYKFKILLKHWIFEQRINYIKYFAQ